MLVLTDILIWRLYVFVWCFFSTHVWTTRQSHQELSRPFNSNNQSTTINPTKAINKHLHSFVFSIRLSLRLIFMNEPWWCLVSLWLHALNGLLLLFHCFINSYSCYHRDTPLSICIPWSLMVYYTAHVHNHNGRICLVTSIVGHNYNIPLQVIQ